MSTLPLAAKVYNPIQLEWLQKYISRKILKGLKIKIENVQANKNGWVQLDISGEDVKAAKNFLNVKIGLRPTNLNLIKKFSTLNGYIKTTNKNKVQVDVGIEKPYTIDAVIPLNQLQAQLTDGRKLALQKIAELYGLCQNMPLTLKIQSFNQKKGFLEASLTEKQLNLYKKWTKTILDKLIIIGATTNEVKQAIKKAKCTRDIIEIETLKLFEHAATCKLGTDAAGIIPKIGKHLKNANLTTFIPQKILNLLGTAILINEN